MSTYLFIGIYKKRDSRASLVFRKPGIVHRITTIEFAKVFIKGVLAYDALLKEHTAVPAHVQEITSPRKKHSALEINFRKSKVEVTISELKGGMALTRFQWTGELEEFKQTLRNFSVMAMFYK